MLGGEFSLIAFLKELLAAGGPGVSVGVGDDAAVLHKIGAELLVSADALVEDVHFRWAWSDPFELGRKTAAVNLSDIAAMGGVPRWATLTVSLPGSTSRRRFEAFVRGVVDGLAEHGATLVGGDLTGSPGPWSVSLTILGTAPTAGALRRSGARAGDDIWVAGALGDAALALRMLEAQKNPCRASDGGLASPWSALLDPRPRCALGKALGASGLAHAAIDISDGIVRDLGHVCAASDVSAELAVEQLPRSHDDWPLVLTGGEDYALLFTAPPKARDEFPRLHEESGEAGPLVRVGRIVGGDGAKVSLTLDGEPMEVDRPGFAHF